MSSRFKCTFEFFTIDGMTASSVKLGEITSLQHKLGDDTVENCALVSITMLASSEFTKVLCSYRNDVIVKLEDDLSGFSLSSFADLYFELRNKF